ncbi:MAG: hypothetical protein HC796_04615 [Synechococcaceae cyanobacterium RL_1_2]|nr:hypothetical protein [Synechococcaceae cyanobacterium RL_1_2]
MTRGLPFLDRPIQTRWQWQDNQLTIAEAQGEGFSTQGTITLKPELLGSGLAAIKTMDLDVMAKDLDGAQLKPFLPANLQRFPLASTVSMEGQVGGNPLQPRVNLALDMTKSRFANVRFEPTYRGHVTIDGTGLNLNLRHEANYLSATLDRNYQPLVVRVDHPQLQLDLERTGANVALGVNRFNLDNLSYLPQLQTLNFNPAMARVFPNGLTENLGGQINARAEFELKEGFGWGTIAIDNPTVSNIKGDRLALEFRRDGKEITIANGELIQANAMGNYQFNGSFHDANHWQGQLEFTDTNVNDVLVAMRIGNLDDLINLQEPSTIVNQGNFPTMKLGLPPKASLEEQLRRISEISVLNAQRRQTEKEASYIPPLLDLDGSLQGKVAFNNDRGNLAIDFDLAGEQWNWADRYQASELMAKGTLGEGKIQLADLKVNLRSLNNPRRPGGLFAMKGVIGDTQQLQVTMEISVAINPFVSLPPSIGFDGLINVRSNITGKFTNPKALGSIEVKDVVINNTAIASTVGSFSYNIGDDPAQLDFFIGAQLQNNQKPLRVEGTIPYQLPFATIAPNSNNLNIAVNLENEGFTLLNILSKDQLQWLAGEGSAQLNISGNFNPDDGPLAQTLVTEGKVILKDAKIASQFLPNDPLTNVNGEITFDLNQVNVNNFAGTFGGGNVSATGSLPIIFSRNLDNPLTINLDRLGLKLKISITAA